MSSCSSLSLSASTRAQQLTRKKCRRRFLSSSSITKAFSRRRNRRKRRDNSGESHSPPPTAYGGAAFEKMHCCTVNRDDKRERNRTVSKDDELVVRGANPRTGVVSPSEAGSWDKDDDNHLQKRPQLAPTHSQGSWQQTKTGWTLVKPAEFPNKAFGNGEPPSKSLEKLEMPDPELFFRYQRDYGKASETKGSSPHLLDPSAPPTPRNQSPLGLSLPPPHLFKIRRKAVDKDDGNRRENSTGTMIINGEHRESSIPTQGKLAKVQILTPHISLRPSPTNSSVKGHEPLTEDPFLGQGLAKAMPIQRPALNRGKVLRHTVPSCDLKVQNSSGASCDHRGEQINLFYRSGNIPHGHTKRFLDNKVREDTIQHPKKPNRVQASPYAASESLQNPHTLPVPQTSAQQSVQQTMHNRKDWTLSPVNLPPQVMPIVQETGTEAKQVGGTTLQRAHKQSPVPDALTTTSIFTITSETAPIRTQLKGPQDRQRHFRPPNQFPNKMCHNNSGTSRLRQTLRKVPPDSLTAMIPMRQPEGPPESLRSVRAASDKAMKNHRCASGGVQDDKIPPKESRDQYIGWVKTYPVSSTSSEREEKVSWSRGGPGSSGVLTPDSASGGEDSAAVTSESDGGQGSEQETMTWSDSSEVSSATSIQPAESVSCDTCESAKLLERFQSLLLGVVSVVFRMVHHVLQTLPPDSTTWTALNRSACSRSASMNQTTRACWDLVTAVACSVLLLYLGFVFLGAARLIVHWFCACLRVLLWVGLT